MTYGDPRLGSPAPGYPEPAPAGFAPPPAAGLVDASGVVTADVPCRKCSYNVRSLPVHGRCPECGTPVGVSVHGDLLRFSEPRWLTGLARGAALLFWGIIIYIGVTFIAGLFVKVLGPLLVQAVVLVAGLVQLYGAWLLTEADPSGIGEDRYGTARKIIRVSLIVGLANSILTVVASQGGMSRELALALTAVGLVAGIIGLVGQFALLRYLERLAMRVPNAEMSARARFLFWAYGGALATILVLAGVMTLVAAAGGRDLQGLALGLGCFILIAGIALLVFGIMFLILLWRLKSAFEEQARYARQVWSAGAQPYGAA